ncbi:MAG: hypothetical protein GW808_09290 [Sphingomonadales bacterium]|nr:hypothetical protein [Sphingomonadales bacterium]PIX66850.1 MAG: hypothetical protein COZ43_04530 [Sphingomonadales bacterium CG_4_10_14_3_um_filter_58_15]NCO49302.1 hypothetical protein [Sphingomonadales bacterium]NCO99474.1 hypothetical protein [Sphingomonadales bacterium]NCP27816.1 hypothetical protein [Sphingomonadales bacterium]
MAKSEVRGLYDDRRKLKFLKELAISSHVANSAEAAGVAVSTVYLWRERDPDFFRAWMRSLAAGYELLEMDLLERARNGVEKPVFHDGKEVATVKHYNDGLGIKLLLAHKQMVALIRAAEEDISPEQVRASLDRKLADMRTKLLRREKQTKPPAVDNDE